MEIVVIDNIDWAADGAALKDSRPDEYIVTTAKSFDAVVRDLETFSDVYKASNDLFYLINVHCIFSGGNAKSKENYRHSDQNGLHIYRFLLKYYDKFQQNLKVAFFSPVPKGYLVKLHPENVVLKHHLVFQVPFRWETAVNEIREWNQSHRWPAFNNASENLLSGWALSGGEKIATNDRRVVFVDDQCVEWETSIREIVDDPNAFYFANYYRERSPSTKFSPEKIYDPRRGDSTLFRTKLHQSDLVISDFYLQENHEIDRWKSYSELAEISGYRLFQFIRKDLDVGVPIVMHTSSNKIRYYQFFDSKGIDGWISKDTRVQPSCPEKQYNYEVFQKTIERFTAGRHAEAYSRLKTIWKRLQKLESLQQANWWFSDTDYPCAPSNGIKKLSRSEKQNLIRILTDCYFAIQKYIDREDAFEEVTIQSNVNFGPATVPIILGKIYEMLELPETFINQYQQFLREFRNAAAHYITSRFVSIDDTLTFFHYWLLALEKKQHTMQEVFSNGPNWGFSIPRDSQFKLLYLWMLFHNSRARPDWGDDKSEQHIQGRIRRILQSVDHEELHSELSRPDAEFGQMRGQLTESYDANGEGVFRIILKNGSVKLKQVEA